MPTSGTQLFILVLPNARRLDPLSAPIMPPLYLLFPTQPFLSLIQSTAGRHRRRPGSLLLAIGKMRARAKVSEPAGRQLQPVLLMAGVSEDGDSRVKLGGGRVQRQGRGPAVGTTPGFPPPGARGRIRAGRPAAANRPPGEREWGLDGR
jgi:hypothetical protein